jgi:signal transduction histidine kinase
MLARAERKGVPPDSPLRTELSEVRQITHNTLERMRSLSQMLHPAILDDYGLAKGIEWYAEVFQRQTGIATKAIVEGVPVRITGQPATNCFRIMQEALNNAAKHSGTKRAEIHAVFRPHSLTLSVRDFGHGLPPVKKGDKPGLGLIAMRERAELLNGKLQVISAPNAGTTVTITMPLTPDDNVSEAAEEHSIGEVISGSYE